MLRFPAVSRSVSSIFASSVLPILFSARVSANDRLEDSPPAPPTDMLAAVSTETMSERSRALRVTAPLVTSLASMSLPLMLASTELVVVLAATTAAKAMLKDTNPAPPSDTPTAWP
ncbi:hypothetical protein GCM10011348_16560 [Marinobacterium nitratireducens]|uniref:Uncharacterized protein n=1 Tax=Marinobacterium nitratireducens TaxID=518897 RepID=A0A917ZE50_9GAMM|nr:hypothetical protein GCM10011348_16560 [Marinobacterium nitratireducens]